MNAQQHIRARIEEQNKAIAQPRRQSFPHEQHLYVRADRVLSALVIHFTLSCTSAVSLSAINARSDTNMLLLEGTFAAGSHCTAIPFSRLTRGTQSILLETTFDRSIVEVSI